MEITKTKAKRPLRVVLYGVDGIGKSTLAATAFPDPIFIDCEDGLQEIDTVSTGRPIPDARTAWGHTLELLSTIDLPYKTLVIDSLDWFERLLHRQLCEQHQAESLGDEKADEKAFAFGRGYTMAKALMAKYLSVLGEFRDKGMNVVLIGHAAVVRHDPPDCESYDKYELSVDKRAAGIVREWADEVWFMRYRTFTRSQELGFGKERKIAVGAGERVLYTQERPAWSAKSRLGLPAELTVTAGFLDEYLMNGKPAKRPARKEQDGQV